MIREANRLCKWRSLLSGWILGTRVDSDNQSQGMRDLQETRLLLRAEVSGLVRILVEKNIITIEELEEIFANEYAALSELLSDKFPGIRATDNGLRMDPVVAVETMKRHGFPP